MAGYGADLDETPRWRLSVLFAIIVIFSLVGHIGLHMLEEYYRKHKRIGLKHTLQSLKDELFALGLITLLLLVFQDQIVKICIDGDSAKDGYYGNDAAKNRKLLAGAGNYECPKGQESFWSITALHEIHILIFLIAIVHLFQAGLSMVCASIRVRRWKKYEDRAVHDMVPLKRKRAIKTKGSWAGLWIYSFFTQFSDSVDGPVYLAIRRFFLEKMELDDDFNFHQFVLDSMEEDFAKLVEFQWVMWLIAAIWILIPWEAHIVIWLPCVFFFIMLIIGAKLQSVAISLATLAYTHYTPNMIPHKKRKSLLKKGASKIKGMLSGPSSKDITSSSKKQQKSVAGGTTAVEMTQQTRDDVESQKQKPQSQIAEFMGQTELLHNSRSLFWFGKPKVMLTIFQYMYFVTGLVLALLILDEWRGQRINHLTGHVLYVLMILVNVVMMIHAAIFVIPSYAITVAAGAYGPDNILKKALERSIKPELAKKLDLERRSFNSLQDSELDSVDGEHGYDSHHGHGHGHGHGHDDIRIGQLLEAMDQSQARKKKMEAVELQDPSAASSGSNSKRIEPIVSENERNNDH
eukprot:TRINITY_DN122_c0_g1_i3.p1 TRINITY_DN122_c0_g1~~TRINITY_DN122_c0_g1_i3.p1  ORF type:complete len:575 (-),score=94.77 TRINITY_DN122_c0_g1_i3:1508-3232(-)